MKQNIIVVSHRRSGTHLTIDAINNNFFNCKTISGSPINLTLDSLTSGSQDRKSLDEFRVGIPEGPQIFKTHMHRDIDNFFGSPKENVDFVKELLATSKVIYVYRDGRDVLSSLYTYLKGHDPRFFGMPFGRFLRMRNDFDDWTYDGSMNRVEYWQHHVRSWLPEKEIFFITFENLRNDYDNSINGIADYLQQERPEKIVRIVRTTSGAITPKGNIRRRIQQFYMQKTKGIRYSAVSFSQGCSGGYIKRFSEEDLLYFNKIAGPLLTELGYST